MMNKPDERNYNLTDEELAHSGVSKILLNENSELKKEILSLKKSLKATQNKLEEYKNKRPLWKRPEWISIIVALIAIPYWSYIWPYIMKVFKFITNLLGF